VLSRDIAIVMTVAIVNLAVTRRTFRPSLAGKLATVVYVTTGVVALYANYRGVRLAIVDWCVYIALAITLVSGAEYVVRMTRGSETAAE
jgi:phosphatidylglycerophosphate synthase